MEGTLPAPQAPQPVVAQPVVGQATGTTMTAPNLDFGDQVQRVTKDGRTYLCAVDLAMLVTGRPRKESNDLLHTLLTLKSTADEAAKILHRKEMVPGFQQPTWVIDYNEVLQLALLLPRKYLREVRDFITRTFARVRAGDQTLHAEIDRQAASDGLEATMAREAVGISPALLERRQQWELEDEEMEHRVKIRKLEYDEKEWDTKTYSAGLKRISDEVDLVLRIRSIGDPADEERVKMVADLRSLREEEKKRREEKELKRRESGRKRVQRERDRVDVCIVSVWRDLQDRGVIPSAMPVNAVSGLRRGAGVRAARMFRDKNGIYEPVRYAEEHRGLLETAIRETLRKAGVDA